MMEVEDRRVVVERCPLWSKLKKERESETGKSFMKHCFKSDENLRNFQGKVHELQADEDGDV